MAEQDLGLQLFFARVYRSALEVEPVLYAELKSKQKQLRAKAAELRDQSSAVAKQGFRRRSKQLQEVAEETDWEASNILPAELGDDPWVIRRRKGDLVVRSLLVSVWFDAKAIFQKDLYSTVGTIVAVILGREDISLSRVREAVRQRDDRVRAAVR